MKKKILLIILLSFFMVQGSFAQKNKRTKKVVLTGYVKDIMDQPIQNATIVVPHSEQTKLTNKKGFYKIKVDPTVTKVLAVTLESRYKEQDYHGEASLNFVFPNANEDGLSEDETEILKTELLEGGYSENILLENSEDFILFNGRKVNPNKYISLRQMLGQAQTTSDYGILPSGLFIIDGVRMHGIEFVESIQPKDVISIKILDLGPAAHIYGNASGVCIIKTKSALAENKKE